MRQTFHPYLPNGPRGDPVLWVDLPDEGHSILVDLGDLRSIAPRRLLRVDRVIVSHTHIDHFIGFDQLLRLILPRRRVPLILSGPAGFLDHVRARIGGYAWNLVENYPVQLVVEEVRGDVVRSAAFRGAGGLRPEPLADRVFERTLATHRAYTIEVAELDHGIPVLGTMIREVERLSVNQDRLIRLGLRPGDWLARLKAQVRRRAAAATVVQAEANDGSTREFTLGQLSDELLFRIPGQSLAYLTDLVYSPENVAAIRELAAGVDWMICESPFLHADAELARERRHLTARQAAELALACGARRLSTFHISPRYAGREELLCAEAQSVFGKPLTPLPAGKPVI